MTCNKTMPAPFIQYSIDVTATLLIRVHAFSWGDQLAFTNVPCMRSTRPRCIQQFLPKNVMTPLTPISMCCQAEGGAGGGLLGS